MLRFFRIQGLIRGLLLLAMASGPAAAAAPPPDSVKIKRWLRISDSLITLAPPKALALADSARRLAHARQLHRLEGLALLATATTAQLRADAPTAAAFAQRAYRQARQHGSPSTNEWKALNLLVAGDFYREDFSEAIRYARLQVAVAEALGQDTLMTRSYDNLGSALSEFRKCIEATPYLLKAREGARRRNDKKFESKSLVNLAVNEFYQERMAPAMAYINEALMLARQQSDSSFVINAFNVRGVFRGKMGQHAGAVADAEQALRLVQQKGHFDEEIIVRSQLSRLYEEAGMLGKALAAERTFWHIRDSTNSLKVQQQLNELNTRFKTEQREARIQALTQAKRLADLRIWALLAGLALVLAGAAVFGRQYQRLRRTQRALAATTRTKDRLYSVVAHDLRSPIASFPGLLDLLRRYRDRAATQDFDGLLTEMRDASQQVARLLENLLQWAASQHGELAVRPETLSLHELITDVAALYTPTAEAAGKRLTVLLPAATEPLRALADRQMTRAILRNLTDNALKYLPAGGTATLSAEAGANGTVVLVISDDGPGLTGAQLAAFQAEVAPVGGATQAEVRGTGLGLPLCRLLAERQGGDLHLVSAPGQGLTARVVLPAAA